MSVKDDAVVLRVPPDNIKMEVARSSIVTLTTAEDRQVLTGLLSLMNKNLLLKTIVIIRGADRLSVRHLRYSQSFTRQGLLASLQKRIHLGLDLKGGTHLILQVQVNDAINADTDRTVERLKDDLKSRQHRLRRNLQARSAEPPRASSTSRACRRSRSGDLRHLVTDQLPEYDLTSGAQNTWTLTMKPAVAKRHRRKRCSRRSRPSATELTSWAFPSR